MSQFLLNFFLKPFFSWVLWVIFFFNNFKNKISFFGYKTFTGFPMSIWNMCPFIFKSVSGGNFKNVKICKNTTTSKPKYKNLRKTSKKCTLNTNGWKLFQQIKTFSTYFLLPNIGFSSFFHSSFFFLPSLPILPFYLFNFLFFHFYLFVLSSFIHPYFLLLFPFLFFLLSSSFFILSPSFLIFFLLHCSFYLPY